MLSDYLLAYITFFCVSPLRFCFFSPSSFPFRFISSPARFSRVPFQSLYPSHASFVTAGVWLVNQVTSILFSPKHPVQWFCPATIAFSILNYGGSLSFISLILTCSFYKSFSLSVHHRSFTVAAAQSGLIALYRQSYRWKKLSAKQLNHR